MDLAYPRHQAPHSDNVKTRTYCARVRSLRRSKEWITKLRTDVAIVGYNDHALSLLARSGADFRARLARRNRGRRRRLGRASVPADRASGESPGTIEPVMRGWMEVGPTIRQPDGGRPRFDRSAIADVRSARGGPCDVPWRERRRSIGADSHRCYMLGRPPCKAWKASTGDLREWSSGPAACDHCRCRAPDTTRNSTIAS